MKNSYRRYVVGIFMMLTQLLLFWQVSNLLNAHEEVSMVGYLIFIFLYLKENIYSFETCLIWEELEKQLKCLTEYMILMGIMVLVFMGPKELWRYELLGIIGFVYSFMVAKCIRLFMYDFLKTNLVVLGVGDTAKELKTVIGQNKFTMYNLVGFLDVHLDKDIQIKSEDIIGNMKSISSILKTEKIDEIIIATSNI
ncbi:MAG: hypothetical protein RR358_03420 [Cetobacterium sp.]